uniref:PGAP2-interacting protein n=1 Tax=Ciona savignyi TaxID=51511 RepID=H2ZJB0_CIOSA
TDSFLVPLACECVIGYTFWSLVHGLGPMIWFYPLNELDITGYELFVLVAFSPILFLLGENTQKFLSRTPVVNFFMLLMLVGAASFHASSTLSRLISLSIGVGAAFIVQTVTWWSGTQKERRIHFWGYTLGFVALLASRIWYVSMTPLWNDHKSNKVIVSLFTATIAAKLIFQQSEDAPQEEKQKKTKKDKSTYSPLVVSLGYGAVFFFLHALLGEVSIIPRYTVSGFPNTGPMPNPWGGLVLLGITLGLLLSFYTSIASQWMWSVIGFASGMGLMFLPTWSAFACGIVLSIYIASVFPTLSEKLVNLPNPGLCMLIANATYLIGVFGMVWCTAYNFVPFGGELARERTYVIIGEEYDVTHKLSLSLPMPEKKYYLMLPRQTTPQQVADAPLGDIVRKCLFAIVLMGLVGFEYRRLFMQTYEGTKLKVMPRNFPHLIWTFHFGYDNRGWPSLDRAAELLSNTGADVITLLESDASKPYLGNNDIAMWLGEKLGMYSDFGPSTRDHTWGSLRNLILSKYPIVNSTHHLLPSPEGELAPAISTTINISGSMVDFVVTHMGNDRDDLDRRQQAAKLSQLCSESRNPVVFLGYVTSSPGSRDYNKLTRDGRMKDIDPTDRDRWCEYIMYRDLIKLGYARISHGGLSDTELQMGRWRIPQGEHTDNFKLTTSDDKIPQSIRFNTVFGSHYVGHWYGGGHHFHMSTPKYFV